MFVSQTIRLAVRTVWSIVGSVVILLSGVINGGDVSCSPNAELIKTEQFTLDESLLMSQGITTDGEYFYTAGSIAALDLVGMAKWTVDDFEKVIYTHTAIPKEIKKNMIVTILVVSAIMTEKSMQQLRMTLIHTT